MVKRLKDDDGTEYEIDDDLFTRLTGGSSGGSSSGSSGGDGGDVLEVPEEALEWLIDQFNSDQERKRQGSSSGNNQTNQTNGKVIRIRAKQSAGSSSQTRQNNSRKRVLKLG